MTSPSERTFTASEVCAGLNVKPSTLRAWRLRDLIAIESPKQGGWNRYTRYDVSRLADFVTLVNRGVRPRHASDQIYGAQAPGLNFRVRGKIKGLVNSLGKRATAKRLGIQRPVLDRILAGHGVISRTRAAIMQALADEQDGA